MSRVLNRFGDTTNVERVPWGKPWDRQPISGKLRRKFGVRPGFAALLHRECLFGLVSLLANRIGDCYRDLILARRGLRQQRNRHRSHHIALGMKTLALL